MQIVENFMTLDEHRFPLERVGREQVSCGGFVVSCKSVVIRLQIVSLPFCSSVPTSNSLAIVFLKAQEDSK